MMGIEEPKTDESPESYDQIDAPMVMVVLIASSIFFGGVVVPATMALNHYMERTMAAVDVVAPADAALTSLDLAQTAKITRYRWVDQTNGVAAIPIDRAMKIYAERQQNQSAAGETGK